MPQPSEAWHPTACILCECNCGIEVRLDGSRITRIRGDKAHPSSAGYTCEKALRLDHYQNGTERLTSPLRRAPDGTFEEIDWDTAIVEVAQRLARVRDDFGGASIFSYGGGGQGNHLGGAYGASILKALGARYRANALSQEKTGEGWVDAKLYGGHTRGDIEHAEVAVFLGKNPWQSHGFSRARPVLKEIAADPARALVVIDPRRTETAELADHHLQVRPGTDAWLLAAMVATLVQEDLVDHRFITSHVPAYADVAGLFAEVDVDRYCEWAGVPSAEVRAVTRRIAAASGAVIFEDLGVQQSIHSTLVSWLEKLVWVFTGNFAKQGGMYRHSSLVELAGGGGGAGGGGRERVSPVVGARIIGGLVPCNVIADEILTDHPDRYRAIIVESGNPAHSLADSSLFREALDSLELVVVIDIAMTETARHAHYVLPAASQFEKAEATFFNFEFPRNVFHLRHRLFEPLPGTLPEPEIHARLAEALGFIDAQRLEPLRIAAASGDRPAFAEAFFATLAADPSLGAVLPLVLYRTLGPTLPAGLESAAAIWGLCHRFVMGDAQAVRRAGVGTDLADDDVFGLGEALFDAVLTGRSGVVFSENHIEENWEYVRDPDRQIHVEVPELVEHLGALAAGPVPLTTDSFPMVLSAGERRSFTANTIFRDPTWRKRDAAGALRIHPDDAAALGVADGARVRVSTARGSAETVAELHDGMWRGHVSLPNGMGIGAGIAPNELTGTELRDPIAGTPWHKHVPARVEAVAAS